MSKRKSYLQTHEIIKEKKNLYDQQKKSKKNSHRSAIENKIEQKKKELAKAHKNLNLIR
jgi:hypothetical protein